MITAQEHQRRAARLLTLAAISRARHASNTIHQSPTPAGQENMNHSDEIEPTAEVKTIAAELFDRLALNADGQPFPSGDPEAWQAADEAEPEIVRLGFAKLRIVDPDAADLALAAGAIDEDSPPTLCMRVRFESAEDQPQRRSGQYIAIDTDAGVKLLFILWLTGEDIHDPAPEGFDLGPDSVRNEAFDVLQPGEALLVQVFDDGDDLEAV